MADRRIEIALDECIARLAAGETVEACLGSYPSLRKRLEPLLVAAASVQQTRPDAIDPDRRLALRSQLTGAIAAAARQRRLARVATPWATLRWLLAPALAVAVVLALLVGLGTSQAPNSAEAATVLTVLDGDVRVETKTGVIAGSNGMELRAGDRVVTGERARAVLSFVDGSSITLDHDTDVSIRSVVATSGQVQVSLSQGRGNTWTYVPASLGPSQLEIDTPMGVVHSSQAAFSTSVDSGGRTQVGAQTGSIDVTSGGKKTNLTAGRATTIEATGLLTAPSTFQPQPRELVLQVTGPAFAVLADPAGASAGLAPPGVPLNQVRGAAVSRTANQLTIRIASPADGTYKISLRAATRGVVALNAVIGQSGGDSATLNVQQDQEFSLALSVQGEKLALGSPVRLEPSSGTGAGVTIPAEVIDKAKATATAATSRSATPSATASPTQPTATATSTRTPAPPTPSPALTASPAPAATMTPVGITPSPTATGTATSTATPATPEPTP